MSMTKEQEKAIEIVNRIRIDFFDNKYESIYTENELEEKYEALCEVLSSLKEKDAEIEEYKRIITTEIINAAKDELVQKKNKEIEQKEKQIDLMAEHIAFNQKVNSYEDIKTYKEQIKQHYENQSKLFKYDYNKKSTLDINSNAEI